MSFCDATRAPGKQFLGVAIVDADGDTLVHATVAAHARGCNPGGEIMATLYPAPSEHLVPMAARNRLLTRAEALAVDAEIKRAIDAASPELRAEIQAAIDKIAEDDETP